MKIPLCVLLLAALCELVSGLVRKHIYVNMNLNWFEAQTYCRTYYNDLTTISTKEEYFSFLKTTGNGFAGWVGLRKQRFMYFTQWSDGSPITYTLLTDNATQSRDVCVYVNSGFWATSDCLKTAGPFFCYTVPTLILVKEQKTWEEALEYCRANYIDLASLTSANDFTVAHNTVNATAVNVWTSLRFLGSLWFWVNGETLDSQILLPSCPVSPYHCGARNFQAGCWEFRDCEEKLSFLCYYLKPTDAN